MVAEGGRRLLEESKAAGRRVVRGVVRVAGGRVVVDRLVIGCNFDGLRVGLSCILAADLFGRRVGRLMIGRRVVGGIRGLVLEATGLSLDLTLLVGRTGLGVEVVERTIPNKSDPDFVTGAAPLSLTEI